MTYENHPVPADKDSNEYATPRRITRKIAATLPTDGDKFDLDPCSGAEDEPHAHEWYTIDDDGLTSPWHGWVFCNPPWSSPANDGRMKSAWLRRAIAHVENGSVDGVVMLLPDDVSTEWFREYAATADYITFCGRVRFEGGRNPAFGVMLLTWGKVPRETLDALVELGATFEGPKLRGKQRTLEEQAER